MASCTAVSIPTQQPNFSSKRNVQTVDITFRNIVLTAPYGKGKKEILKSISGEFRSGVLTAIMGSSGAGKSTLMNVLAGFISLKVKGDILVNGAKRSMNKFRKISCYIMQADELCPLLTVQESMELAANLKLGDSIPPEAKKPLIEEILESMSLTQVKDTRTCILSSGEQKRLAIALELVNNPPVLFFDEPTSRLDSSSCVQFVSMLRNLARSGRTVICVIHQPSSSVFEMFDELYMMADGKCIYHGPTSDLVGFLSKSVGLDCPKDHNPADYVIDVAVGKYGPVVDKLVEATKASRAERLSLMEDETIKTLSTDKDQSTSSITSSVHDGIEMNQKAGSPRETSLMLPVDEQLSEDSVPSVALHEFGAPFWAQFRLLYWRSLQCTMRDLTLTHLRFVIQIFLAVMVSVIYYGIGNDAGKLLDNISFLFINQFVLMFGAIMATCVTFPLELPVLVREHLNNWYTLKAYYLAKSTADLPFEVAYTTLYVSVVYFATDQPFETSRFFMYLAAGMMNSFMSQSVGLTIGIAFQLEVAAFMGPIACAICILLAGFLLSMSTAPVYLSWIFYTVYYKFAFQASLVSVYGFDREKLNCSTAYCMFKSPISVLQQFEVEGSIYWVDMLVLVVYFVFIRALAYFLLWRRIRYAEH